MTPSESPGISKIYKGLFAAHLDFQHHALWAPSQRWWFSTHHLLVAWTWPWGFKLAQYHFYSSHQSSTLEKISCFPAACAWTTCPLQHAPAGSCISAKHCSLSVLHCLRRAHNLQTRWDTYSNVLSNPFRQKHLILGKSPVNKRGRHEEQLGFLLHFCKRNHIICHGCWSPGTYSQMKTTDLWVCLS